MSVLVVFNKKLENAESTLLRAYENPTPQKIEIDEEGEQTCKGQHQPSKLRKHIAVVISESKCAADYCCYVEAESKSPKVESCFEPSCSDISQNAVPLKPYIR